MADLWTPLRFESGSPIDEADEFNGTLAFTASAALEGAVGMEVGSTAADRNRLRMNNLVWGTLLRVGFRFDPNGVTKAADAGQNSFFTIARFGASHIGVELKLDPTPAIRVSHQGVSNKFTGSYYTLSDSGPGPYEIEIEHFNDASSGYVKLFVNNVDVGVGSSGLDTTMIVVTTIEFGKTAQNYTFAGVGKVYFDDIRANDDGSPLFVSPGDVIEYQSVAAAALGVTIAENIVMAKSFSGQASATGDSEGVLAKGGRPPAFIIPHEGITLPTVTPAPPAPGEGVMVELNSAPAAASSAAQPTVTLTVTREGSLEEWATPWKPEVTNLEPVEGSIPSYGNAQHPVTLFDTTALAALRASVRTPGYHKDLYDTLRLQVDLEGSSMPQFSLLECGLCYAIESDVPATAAQYGSRVYNRLNSMRTVQYWEAADHDRTQGDSLYNYALGYDLCYDYISQQSQHQSILDKLALETQTQVFRMQNHNTRGNSWNGKYNQNHYHRQLVALSAAVCAMLTEAGNPVSPTVTQATIDSWVTYLKGELHKTNHCHRGKVDGGSYEGTWYASHHYTEIAYAAYIAKQCLNYDALSVNTALRYSPIFQAYMARPWGRTDELVMSYGDISIARNRVNYLIAVYRMMAREHGDETAQWAAQRIGEAMPSGQDEVQVQNQSERREFRFDVSGMDATDAVAFEILAYDGGVPATSPQGVFPPWYHAEDEGVAIMREGWADPDEFIFSLRASPPHGRSIYNQAKLSMVWDPAVNGGGNQGGGYVAVSGEFGNNQGIDKLLPSYPQDYNEGFGHCHGDAGCIMLCGDSKFYIPELSGNTSKNDGSWGRYPTMQNVITVDGWGQIGTNEREGSTLNGYKETQVGARHWHEEREDIFKMDNLGVNKFCPSLRTHYAMAEITEAYPTRSKDNDPDCPRLNITDARRHTIFLKTGGPVCVVVVDNMDSSLNHNYRWNLCSVEEPVRDADWLKSYVTASEMLAVKTLEPLYTQLNFNKKKHPDVGEKPAGEHWSAFNRSFGDGTVWEWGLETITSVTAQRFVTFMTPRTDADYAQKPTVTFLAQTSTHVVLRVQHSDLSEDLIFLGHDEPGEWTAAGYTLDCTCAVIREDSVGNIKQLFIADGTKLHESPNVVLLESQNGQHVNSLGVSLEGTELKCTGLGVQPFRVRATNVSAVEVNQASPSFSEAGGVVSVS